MSDMPDELPLPLEVISGARKLELARIWIVDGRQIVILSPEQWPDPAAWGLMLVDLARHVASSYEQKGHDREHALERLRAGFDAEWSSPTD